MGKVFANACNVIFCKLVYLCSYLKTDAPWTNGQHISQEGRPFACKEAFPGVKRHLAHKLIFSTKSLQQQFHIYALVVEDLYELGASRFSRGGFPVKESQSKQWLILNCAPSFYLLLLISQVLKGIISASAGGKLIARLLPQASTFPAHFSVCPGGTEGCPHIALWESVQSPTCKSHSLGTLVSTARADTSVGAGAVSFNKET